jgi:hypothetical protein
MDGIVRGKKAINIKHIGVWAIHGLGPIRQRTYFSNRRFLQDLCKTDLACQNIKNTEQEGVTHGVDVRRWLPFGAIQMVNKSAQTEPNKKEQRQGMGGLLCGLAVYCSIQF